MYISTYLFRIGWKVLYYHNNHIMTINGFWTEKHRMIYNQRSLEIVICFLQYILFIFLSVNLSINLFVYLFIYLAVPVTLVSIIATNERLHITINELSMNKQWSNELRDDREVRPLAIQHFWHFVKKIHTHKYIHFSLLCLAQTI